MKTKLFLYPLLTFIVLGLVYPVKANTAMVKDTISQAVEKIVVDTLKQDPPLLELEEELDALEKKQDNDTTKIRIGKMKIKITEDGNDVEINKGGDDWGWDDDDDDFNFHSDKKSDRFDPHWASVSIGWNNYMAANQALSLPEELRYMDLNTNTSLEFNLNMAELGINLVKDHIGLVTGVGLRWNNYKFANTSVRLSKGVNELEHVFDSTTNTDKSKLMVTYLTVPLMIEFQARVNHRPLYLAAGVEGALKLGAKTKWKTESGSKTKERSDFYINPFTYVLAARLGYDEFGLYGTYSLQSLFKENEGPELYPFTLGISFNF